MELNLLTKAKIIKFDCCSGIYFCHTEPGNILFICLASEMVSIDPFD